ALDVGDVEALDATREFFEGEGVLQSLGYGFLRREEDAEALVVRLFGVLADEVDEGAFFTALRDGDFDAVATLFSEQVGEQSAVREVNRDEDGAGEIALIEIELLEEGGEEGRGRERGRWLIIAGCGFGFGDGGDFFR